MGTPIRLGRFKLRKLNLRGPFTWFGFGKGLLLEEDQSRRGPADGNNNTIHAQGNLVVRGWVVWVSSEFPLPRISWDLCTMPRVLSLCERGS